MNTANYIRKRTPLAALNGKTPYELWHGKAPDESKLKVFESRVYYLDTEPGKEKLDQRSREGIFIGYSDESKGYRLWLPEKRKVIMSRNVKFLETEGSSKDMTDNKTQASTSKENSNQTFEEIPHPVENFQKPELELNDSETDSEPQNTEFTLLRHQV